MERNDLFDVEKGAEELASRFYRGTFNGKNQPITSAQLRKFYNEFKTLERKFELGIINKPQQEVFGHILPQIKINKAKVSYAHGRKAVPDEFKQWLLSAIDNINSPEEFKAFLLHFEAIVGYTYGLGLKD